MSEIILPKGFPKVYSSTSKSLKLDFSYGDSNGGPPNETNDEDRFCIFALISEQRALFLGCSYSNKL